MKMKLLPLFLMVLMIFSAAQPIFADNPQLGDTKITGADDEPLKDITVNSGSSIELQARLYYYAHISGPEHVNWYPDAGRYLDFYAYKSNVDGTNGQLVWSDTAMTNLFTYNANPDEFTLTEKGTYNLLVKYEGNRKHCSGTAKIYVV